MKRTFATLVVFALSVDISILQHPKLAVNWPKAHSTCIERGEYLPGVLTHQDVDLMSREMESRGLKTAWVGIKRHIYPEPRWTDATKINSEISINSNITRGCGVLSTTSEVQIERCKQTNLGGLCDMKGCTQCRSKHPASVCFSHRNRCFLIFCGLENWYEAHTLCHKQDSSLATLNDTLTVQAVADSIRSRNIQCVKYWIGLSSSHWRYTDNNNIGTSVSKHFWPPTEPKDGNNCAVLEKINGKYTWRSEICSKRHTFICLKAHITTEVTEESFTKSTERPMSEMKWWIWLIIGIGIFGLIFVTVLTILKLTKVQICKGKHKDDKTAIEMSDASAKIPSSLMSGASAKIPSSLNASLDDDQTSTSGASAKTPLLKGDVHEFSQQSSIGNTRTKSDILDEDRKDILLEKIEELSKKIIIDQTDIIDILQEDGVLTEKHDTVKNIKHDAEKVKFIIKLLKSKPNNHFDSFCWALWKTGQRQVVQQFLYNDNDFQSMKRKIAQHYDDVFTDITLYTSDKESDKAALYELYVPMVWKKVEDPDSVMEDKDISSPLQLFKHAEQDSLTRIVIDGEPGSGKTTFMKSLCGAWSSNIIQTRKKYKDHEFMLEYDIVLGFILRQVSKHHTLIQMLQDQFEFLTCAEVCSILECLKSGKVCLIFDGFDELKEMKGKTGQSGKYSESDIIKIITRRDKKDVFCITTMRSQSLIDLQSYSSQAFQAHVKLCGFNDAQIREYIGLYFNIDEERANGLISHIDSKKQWKLASIPIRLQMMCFVWKQFNSLGETSADLYRMLVLGLLDHKEKRDANKPTNEDTVHTKYEDALLLPTAQLANTWDDNGNLQILFTLAEIEKVVGDKTGDIFDFGCITKYFPTSFMKTVMWNFSHLSLQEYFVAYHIANSPNQQDLDEFLKKCSNIRAIERHHMILEFLCNLAPEKANTVITRVVKRLTTEKECNNMLQYMLQYVKAFKDSAKVDIPLPKSVSVGTMASAEKDPVTLLHVSELFKIDQRKHQNVNFLKIYDIDSCPPEIEIGNVSGLYLDINRQDQMQKAGKIISKLSTKAKQLDIQLLEENGTPAQMDEMLQNIKTNTITMLSITAPGVMMKTSKVINEQRGLVSLTLNNTNNSWLECEKVSEIYTETKKKSEFKELRLKNYWMVKNVTSLGSNIRITLTNELNTVKEFSSFSEQLKDCNANIHTLDLSFSKFTKKPDSKGDRGRTIGMLILNLKSFLKILKLRSCGLTDSTLLIMTNTINEKVLLLELDLLGNPIEKCQQLQKLKECFPALKVLLFTCVKDIKLSDELTMSKLMATGKASKATEFYLCENNSPLEELYLIYCIPNFTKINTLDRLLILYILHVPEYVKCLELVSKNLKYTPKLEELHLTAQTPREKSINEMLNLIEKVPKTLKLLNLHGYYCKPVTHILQRKQHLKQLRTLNIGSKETIENEYLQIIRQELQQLNNQIEVFSEESESLNKILHCSVNPPSEITVQSSHLVNELLKTLK